MNNDEVKERGKKLFKIQEEIVDVINKYAGEISGYELIGLLGAITSISHRMVMDKWEEKLNEQ